MDTDSKLNLTVLALLAAMFLAAIVNLVQIGAAPQVHGGYGTAEMVKSDVKSSIVAA